MLCAAVRCQSLKWVTDSFTASADIPRRSGAGFVAVRNAAAKVLATVDDPNAKYIYGLFFHRVRYPATHLPIQLGLPTSLILSKYSPTFTPIFV